MAVIPLAGNPGSHEQDDRLAEGDVKYAASGSRSIEETH